MSEPFRHSLQEIRFKAAARLDKCRIRLDKGTTRTPALSTRIHQEWTDREDTDFARLVPGTRDRGTQDRRERR